MTNRLGIAGGREVKKEIKINFRVEVYPRTTKQLADLYGITVAEEEDVCISIVADINRHVNDVRFTEIVSDRAKRGSMETVVLPSESVQKLLAIAHHAIMLEKWLGENLGQNDEWPMQLIASTETDEAAAEEVSKMLSAMGLAGREVKADGECMRQLMRWQIETFGNPYGDVNELL